MARVAVGQMCAGADWRANLAAAGRLAAQARAAGCGLLCLPEACAFLGGGAGAGQRFASALDGPVMAEYRALARREGLWLSVGGFQERPPEAAAAAAGAAGGAGRGGDGRPDGSAGDGGAGGAPRARFSTLTWSSTPRVRPRASTGKSICSTWTCRAGQCCARLATRSRGAN